MALGLGMLLIGVLGCAEEEDTGTTDTGPCADVPLLTYANFGRGFLTEYCQGCHASTTLDRHGAPESVTFDNLGLAWEKADRILERSLGGTMPPSGGTSEDDLTQLEWWLTCGEEGL